MSWAEQFARSVTASGEWTEDGLAGYAPTEVQRGAFPLLARAAFRRVYIDGLEDACGRCESPIEEAILYAIVLAADSRSDALEYRSPHPSPGAHSQAPTVLFVEPQANAGDYRVDFLLTARERWGFGDSFADAEIVIECDGHDYHERTKEQARRDRARDRALQARGLRVYRYTGSEIWADVYRCAKEATDAVIALACEASRVVA